jgi:molecular chaperone HtpG
MIDLASNAEQRAYVATSLPSFPINLVEIKRTVSTILSQFGKGGIFAEYTTHDISHVNDMLSTLDWMIPKTTADKLNPAEWLMIVLSIYFHDMGLIVTPDEFSKRGASNFPKFCEKELFANSSGQDYKAKVDKLPHEEREKFLYQEFVRHNHGARVKYWIEGTFNGELGSAKAQLDEVDRLLKPLDADFRKDLAIVCESHNLDDLDNIEKYRLSHPYGNSDDETVNLQYCAALLRTVDLIQITRQRAPSTLFKLINPVDPISQSEWAKQNAVKRVRAKMAQDREGNAAADIQSNTIEVFATFTEQNGFFGINSYLRYAEEQIATTYNIMQKTRSKTAKVYDFPWRYVDETSIQVDGFVKKPFGFEIDQGKILDLLTGHTLYNNSDVVIRELVQNSIDAVRLQYAEKNSHKDGNVHIIWDPELSELTVQDNGTGMTQEIVENHLLKVGSSRYQDAKFREAHPDFSPISRFGIGVLSAFMVADSVEIITVSANGEQARQILLRSVHGKYLIQLLDKTKDTTCRQIGPHGTIFRLKFRSTAKVIDILSTVRNYVVVPRCKVTVTIVGQEPVAVGYDSPKSALEAYLQEPSTMQWFGDLKTKVEEKTIDGITLAYALSYNSHYRDWRLISGDHLIRRTRNDRRAPISTCVEGIVVESSVPGLGVSILAIANAVGKSAPKTNVARSSLEATEERRKLMSTCLKIIFSSVTAEALRLNRDEGYSLTWSTEEIPYLLAPALNVRNSQEESESQEEALSEVPLFLLESDGKRMAQSLADIIKIGSFWTVDSLLTRSVEQFIREAKSEVTADKLIFASQGTTSSLPQGAIATNLQHSMLVSAKARSRFEPAYILGHVSDRRLDMRWDLVDNRWITSEDILQKLYEKGNNDIWNALKMLREATSRVSERPSKVYIPRQNVMADGLEGYFCVSSLRAFYLLPGTPIAKLLLKNLEAYETADELAKRMLQFEVFSLLENSPMQLSAGISDHFYKLIEESVPSSWLSGQDELNHAITETGTAFRVYNPLSWRHREEEAGM